MKSDDKQLVTTIAEKLRRIHGSSTRTIVFVMFRFALKHCVCDLLVRIQLLSIANIKIYVATA
jgi:hypothetical protein